MTDSEWRTPEHEVYERMSQDAEAAERRGPWPMPSLDDAIRAVKVSMIAAFDAERKRNLAAYRAMTPAEREADALLALAVRREMASRERRDGTYYPEAGDVVHRLGDDERHERAEDDGEEAVADVE